MTKTLWLGTVGCAICVFGYSVPAIGQTSSVPQPDDAAPEAGASGTGPADSAADPPPANSGRSEENAVQSAEDAFGTQIGREALGLYGPGSVRGFSPTAAGNVRIEGLFFDQQAGLTGRVQSGSRILVGPSAQVDPFPAPTGIVDYSLRDTTQPGTSVLASIGPYGSYGAEFDHRVVFGNGPVSVSAGAGLYRDTFANGGSADALATGLVAAYKRAENVTLRGFWGRTEFDDETAPIIYIPRDPTTPPAIARGSYDGPEWVLQNGVSENLGFVADFAAGPWRVELGGFRSINSQRISFANIVEDIAADGTGQRVIFANPSSRFASSSGELKVSRSFSDGPRQHQILFDLRARSVESRFGGSDFIDLGRAALGAEIAPPRPDFQFSDQTLDSVRQLTGGVSYGLRWSDIFELRLGLQIARYDKQTVGPASGELALRSEDLLPNVTASLAVTPEVLLYGSYTRGLEENGQTPDFAVNRLNLLPALVTSQVDFGLRWKPSDTTNVVIGYFKVDKPYFNLDPDDVFRQLGDEVHEGIELSIKARPTPPLTIVAGAVIQDPRVVSERPIEGVGLRPVAQPKVVAQANFEYAFIGLAGVSVDGTLDYTGSRLADVSNAVRLDGYFNLSLGARYQFKLGQLPATLRISVQNVTNNFEWLAIGSGVYEPLNQRSLDAYIAIDF